ncbi:MAG: nucleoside/nucleotide kinase family protein [Shimia sp.]|uniref:nucleoside/nucleotide kinase family protein n=1 Tax=Shimia sp. TaxID=1954381 RepID=UPI001B1BD2FF|nr:nucleoside/nucleotide kinase family protein [Shimia sp.]MBO6899112.1 nucleoside/nucleotide kinase family protein [Shimia sp.]
MTRQLGTIGELADAIDAVSARGRRKLIALAGPPASGKSTLATQLAQELTKRGAKCAVVPMDGYHLSNQSLIERGLLDRKGAPETFDTSGFRELVVSLREKETVPFPTFNRERDITLPGGGVVEAECDTVILEGNYLLFDAPIWRDLRPFWDLSIALSVDEAMLRNRLVDRWLKHGLTAQMAEQRAEENDLRNARAVLQAALTPDIRFAR